MNSENKIITLIGKNGDLELYTNHFLIDDLPYYFQDIAEWHFLDHHPTGLKNTLSVVASAFIFSLITYSVGWHILGTLLLALGIYSIVSYFTDRKYIIKIKFYNGFIFEWIREGKKSKWAEIYKRNCEKLLDTLPQGKIGFT